MTTILLCAFLIIWLIPPALVGGGILLEYTLKKNPMPGDLRPWIGFFLALSCIPFLGIFLVGKMFYDHFRYSRD